MVIIILFNRIPQKHGMIAISSKDHQLKTVGVTKTSLSPHDDQRYILNDGLLLIDSN